MMFFKHVFVTFKQQWVRFVLLGLLMVVSSFSYVVINVSTRSVQEGALPFFETMKQEEFTLYMNPFITEEEFFSISACRSITNPLLVDIENRHKACYETIIDTRIETLRSAFDNLTFEYRFFKDLRFEQNGGNHRLRVLKDTQSINLSLITEGVAPTTDDQIAISKNYAINNQLEIGDTLSIDQSHFTITGFVLFPDYNLPILDQIYLFDTVHQTLGLMTDQAFTSLSSAQDGYISGLFNGTIPDDFETRVASFEFITYAVLTENNVRSGAIYAEIEAGQSTGLALSILVAFIGIMIVIVMIVKSLDQSRGAMGIFKALGGRASEMMIPYCVVLSLFTVFFLSIGVYLGYLTGPWLRDLYLMFYLLPEEAVRITLGDVSLAILAPLLTVLFLTIIQLRKILKQKAIVLMQPKVTIVKPNRFRRLRTLFERFEIKTRIQVAFLLRQYRKVLIYIIGVVSAIFLMFLSMGMVNVFDQSVIAYYESSSIQSVVYCDRFDCDPKDFDKVLEIPVVIDGFDAVLTAIDEDNQTRTLYDRRGNELNSKLTQGLVITKSFADLSRLKVGDTVTVRVANERLDLTILGVADLYPGNTVFYDRAVLSQLLFDFDGVFNLLYSSERIDDDLYRNIVHVDEIIEQISFLNRLVETMMVFIMVSAGIMALIIIYLLTVLSVEDQTYEISLFKVIGYDSKEISKMVLGGYQKLNVFLFILTIPITLVAFYVLRLWMIQEFGFFLPIRMQLWHVLIALIVFITVYAFATMRAKHNVAKRSLQEALKITQI